MDTDSINVDLFLVWCKFWCCVWFGTAIGGSVFGLGLVFFITNISSPLSALTATIIGPTIGGLWAGTVGLFVIPSFALLMYICFCSRRPLILACVAGALTGIVSLPTMFLVTGPFGAVGAFYYAKIFLSSPDSWLLREAEERRLDNKSQPFNFTIASLFARTAAAAVLVAFWTFLIRNLFDFAFM